MNKLVKILILGMILIITAFTIVGIISIEKTNQVEIERLLNDNIKQSIMTCYVIEGRYPPSLDYLKNNYSLYVDEENFGVYYQFISSNVFPDVTVIPKVREQDGW